VYIGVHGCYCFHLAETALTGQYPKDQRSVCTQMSNHSELLVPNFLAVMQKVVKPMTLKLEGDLDIQEMYLHTKNEGR